MKINSPFKSKKSSAVLSALFGVVVFVLFNSISESSTSLNYLRELKKEQFAAASSSSFTYRYLSKNLGNGLCKWTPPKFLKTYNTEETTALITSYPGSGKRLVWRIIEALTGKRVGDDWNLSRNGFDRILTLKTSYPHPDGAWQWGDVMNRTILLVRNPRYAIPSYHNMRLELNYSTTWEQSIERVHFVYTKRSDVRAWNQWRNGRWYKELNRWCYHIDFWMNGGLHRVSRGQFMKDYHCENNRHLDCEPKAVIQFEKLYSSGPGGVEEALKLGAALDGLENSTNIIEEEARPCVYKEVMKRPEFYNKARDGSGLSMGLMPFHYTQLDLIRQRLARYRDKYSSGKWVGNKNAETLAEIFDSYYNEVNEEYEVAAADYYEEKGFVYEMTDGYNLEH